MFRDEAWGRLWCEQMRVEVGGNAVADRDEAFHLVLAQAIDLAQVFTEPQIVYFQLSTLLGPGSAPEIGRLAAFDLLADATLVKRECPVYLVIDEVQRMVAKNLEYLLQLARSMGVGVILANQTMEDLRTSRSNLIPTIETNCRYRQWFSVSAVEDRRRLIESSGETPYKSDARKGVYSSE